jgi:23S rRNA (cytosine1962-C5)-methyltransferase
MTDLILKPGREKSLLRRHPWIFSGAVHHVDGTPASGETINLLSFKSDFLAQAAYSPTSQIRARVWTFDPDETVDAGFFRRRIQAAIRARAMLGFLTIDTNGVQSLLTLAPTSARPGGRAGGDVGLLFSNAYRLIHAESDGLPGLIVDRYGETLVLQSLMAGSEFWKEIIADVLLEETGLETVYERSDADVRELEGLQPVVGLLRGTLPDAQFAKMVSNSTSTWNPVTKPASTSTSAKTVCAYGSWQKTAMYWIVSVTRAGSRSMRWREEPGRSWRWMLPRRRCRWGVRISN